MAGLASPDKSLDLVRTPKERLKQRTLTLLMLSEWRDQFNTSAAMTRGG